MRTLRRLVFGMVGYLGILASALADVHFVGASGQTLKVRFNDSNNKEVTLTAGSGATAGLYSTTDAAIVTATQPEGLPAGTYVARILTSSNVDVGLVPEFHWSGSTEITPADKTVAAMNGYNNVLHVGSGQTYATIAAAVAAAAGGDLIVIHKGTYDESDLQKQDVTYYFAPGAKVDNSSGIGTEFNGTSNCNRFAVLGYGEFTGSAGGVNILTTNNISSTTPGQIYFEGSRFTSSDGNAIVLMLGNSTNAVVRMVARDYVSTQGPLLNTTSTSSGLALSLSAPVGSCGSLVELPTGSFVGRCDLAIRNLLVTGATAVSGNGNGKVAYSGVANFTHASSTGFNSPGTLNVILNDGGVIVPSGRPSLSGSGSIFVTNFAYDTASSTASALVATTDEKTRADAAAILDDTGTSGVKIVDDGITASKFDETTAFPVRSADTGITALARTGADADTLETLSDQSDTIGTAAAAILDDTGTSGVKLAANSVTSTSIQDGAITADKLGSDVTTTLQNGLALEASVQDVLDFFDGAPTFAEAMDEHHYTTERADKIDKLAPTLLLSTTIDDDTPSQTSFTLASGPPDHNALNGALVIVTRPGTPPHKAVALVKHYDKDTKTLTLVTDPGIFDFENGDTVDVIASGSPAALWLGGSP